MKKKSDYERGYIDALRLALIKAKSSKWSLPFSASTRNYNRGVLTVAYKIEELLSSAERGENDEV